MASNKRKTKRKTREGVEPVHVNITVTDKFDRLVTRLAVSEGLSKAEWIRQVLTDATGFRGDPNPYFATKMSPRYDKSKPAPKAKPKPKKKAKAKAPAKTVAPKKVASKPKKKVTTKPAASLKGRGLTIKSTGKNSGDGVALMSVPHPAGSPKRIRSKKKAAAGIGGAPAPHPEAVTELPPFTPPAPVAELPPSE